MPKSNTDFYNVFSRYMIRVHKIITALNKSKMFAGLIVLSINIGSRFVNFRLSKSIENYLKYAFNRNLLVFCISWMGSRDIYLALFVTCLFSLFADVLLNESSNFCILSKTFTEEYTNMQPSEDDIVRAKDVLKRANIITDTDGGNDTSVRNFSPS